MRWLAILLLAGCMTQGPATYRKESKPLSGTTRFDVTRFAGDWRAVSCVGPCAKTENYLIASQQVVFRKTAAGQSEYYVERPGVLRRKGTRDRIIVMWVDDGYRTAAIGDADGRWAAIIDRGTGGGADRIEAARKMLKFNGYKTSAMTRR